MNALSMPYLALPVISCLIGTMGCSFDASSSCLNGEKWDENTSSCLRLTDMAVWDLGEQDQGQGVTPDSGFVDMYTGVDMSSDTQDMPPRMEDMLPPVLCPDESQISCSGHGVCDEQTGTCTCERGYRGAQCESCASGFVKDAREVCIEDTSPMCVPACVGSKTCRLNAQQLPTCGCVEGQQDDNADGLCQPTCATQFPNGDACSAHGTCVISMAPGPLGGKTTCVCDDGYVADMSSMRPNCGACATTHVRVDDVCLLRAQCDVNACSSGGECADDTGFIMCECFDAYMGDRCESCATGYVRGMNGRRCVQP